MQQTLESSAKKSTNWPGIKSGPARSLKHILDRVMDTITVGVLACNWPGLGSRPRRILCTTHKFANTISNNSAECKKKTTRTSFTLFSRFNLYFCTWSTIIWINNDNAYTHIHDTDHTQSDVSPAAAALRLRAVWVPTEDFQSTSQHYCSVVTNRTTTFDCHSLPPLSASCQSTPTVTPTHISLLLLLLLFYYYCYD